MWEMSRDRPKKQSGKGPKLILNPPTAASLNDVALRLYFTAWSSLISIVSDFETHFEALAAMNGEDDDEDGRTTQRHAYLEACQPELQSICTIVQQSNELALKAKLCAVSPYLLLLKTDPKLSNAGIDVEFSELRTLDAVDLPGAVNTFCPDRLSPDFVNSYNLFRTLRNKVAHLGSANAAFSPEGLLREMVSQYLQLWPERKWLADWVAVESGTRLSYFHDYSYSSPYSAVFEQWPRTIAAIGKGDFKRLFGFNKSRRRYRCPQCVSNAASKYPPEAGECETAFLTAPDAVHCVMCGNDWEVSRDKCSWCNGSVISEEHGLCLVCGYC